ncbi:hypothetical protein H7X46_04525 [Pseudonocardia sp. C8]|uniref:hypothetical protein n=1 Tax=Pseudonocardia sp. C8 TaxID=2762759 RepID=UPI00164362DD|nr:hypothetical protein [Pseudonocardia sp. C8]MBC3190323.1 hypothetical protein [Pseudonocardia sp. C8]
METLVIGIVVAFCAGAFGAALGAVGAVTLTGLAAFVALLVAPGAGHVDFLGVYAFGLYLGPHVSFAPAIVAAAYAGRKRYLAEDGKDILTPLISTQRVTPLLVGGVFGSVGYVMQTGLSRVFGDSIDTIALTVVVLCIAAKLFGRRGMREIIGTVPPQVAAAGGRYDCRNPVVWLPWQATAPMLVTIGLVVGGLGGWIAWILLQNPATESLAIIPAWAIGVVSFFFFISGLKIPVTHHVGMVGAIAVVQSHAVYPTSVSILWGLAFGIVGAVGGEFLSRTFNTFGHGYVDPPAAIIFVGSVVVNVGLTAVGAFKDQFVVPTLIIAVSVLYALLVHRKLRRYETTAQRTDEIHESAAVTP